MTKNRKVDVGIVLFALFGILGMMIPGYQIWHTLPFAVQKPVIGPCVALFCVIVIAVEDFKSSRMGIASNIAIVAMLPALCVVTWAVIIDLGPSMAR